MEKKKYPRKREIFVRFRVNEAVRDMIQRRMEQTGVTNLRAYMLKMAIDGRVIHVELDSIREMVRLLSNATNNINQIAQRVNSNGNFYAADMADLAARYDELWTQAKTILQELAEI